MVSKRKLGEPEKNMPNETAGRAVESETLLNEIEGELSRSLDELERLKAKIIPMANRRGPKS